jgi:aminoglycoside/choline kinase family phosphotransferase
LTALDRHDSSGVGQLPNGAVLPPQAQDEVKTSVVDSTPMHPQDLRFVGLFDPRSPRLQLIAGDASDRKFFRCREGDASFICMQFPSWRGGYGGDPLSWLGMHHVLEQWRLPVPAVVHVDESNACIWTTDLGDHFLNRDLGSLPFDARRPEHHKTFTQYQEALKLLIAAQYPMVHGELQHPAKNRFFDQEKLLFELNFFGEHFLQGLLECEIPESLRQEWLGLATEIAKFEPVLCHRDYHARNLMVCNDAVHWIDFQDARLGPHLYDVVSLLRDSYVRFHPDTREQLFQDYFGYLNQARVANGKDPMTAAGFHRERLMVGLQRNIKALGSFAYLFRIKGKKVYLSFVCHTVDLILAESKASEMAVRYPATFRLLDALASGKEGDRFRALTAQQGIDHF